MNIVIADIDGCCLDPAARIGHYLDGDLDKYHDLHHTDVPIPQGVAIYRMFQDNPSYLLLFVTARLEIARRQTLLQLQEHVHPDIKSTQLLMYPDFLDGSLPPEQMKPFILEHHGYKFEDVFLAFDDRTKTVEAWRNLGIVSYQTAVEGG